MKSLLTCLILLTFSVQSYGTHVMGAHISYTQLDTFKYHILISYFRDCKGVAFGNPSSVTRIRCLSGGSATVNLKLKSIENITPLHDTTPDPCYPVNTYNTGDGVEKHTYEVTIDFNSSPYNALKNCCDLLIETGQCCRNNAITTGVSGNFYNYTKISPCLGIINQSPEVNFEPITTLCCNQPARINLGVIQKDPTDSLSFKWGEPLSGYGNSLSYTGTYLSYQHPFSVYYPGSLTPPYNNRYANPPIGINLDNTTGEITFTPVQCGQITVMVLEVEEWRRINDSLVQIGLSRYDVQYNVETCPDNNPPSVETEAFNFSYDACVGETICFKISSKDEVFVPPPPASSPPQDSSIILWDSGISNASFTIIDSNARNQAAEFCWTPDSNDLRPYVHVFNVKTQDNHGPKNAVSVQSFKIAVHEKINPKILMDTSRCGVLNFSYESGFEFSMPPIHWEITDTNNQQVNSKNAFFLFSGDWQSELRSPHVQFQEDGVYRIHLYESDTISSCMGYSYVDIDASGILDSVPAGDISFDTLGCGRFIYKVSSLDTNEAIFAYIYGENGILVDSTSAHFKSSISSISGEEIDTILVHSPGEYEVRINIVNQKNACTKRLVHHLIVDSSSVTYNPGLTYSVKPLACGQLEVSASTSDSDPHVFQWRLINPSGNAYFQTLLSTTSSQQKDTILFKKEAQYGIRLSARNSLKGCAELRTINVDIDSSERYYESSPDLKLDSLDCGWYTIALDSQLPYQKNLIWKIQDSVGNLIQSSEGRFISTMQPISSLSSDSFGFDMNGSYRVELSGNTYNPSCFLLNHALIPINGYNLLNVPDPPVIIREQQRIYSSDNSEVYWYRNDTLIAIGPELTFVGPGVYKAQRCNQGCCSEFSNEVERSIGFEQIDIDEFKVYPNPGQGEFKIISTSPLQWEDVQITVFSSTGAEVQCSLEYDKNELSINIPGSAGIYYLKIQSGSSIRMIKLIKL